MKTLEELVERVAMSIAQDRPRSAQSIYDITNRRFLSLVQSPEFREAIIGECEWRWVGHGWDDESYDVECCKNENKEQNFCCYCGKKIKEERQ